MEKQRLAHRSLHGLGQERLGDQIGRLRAFAGQKLFRIGGDENHGNIEGRQNFVDGVDARAAFAQIDVRQYQTGTLGFGLGDGFVLGRGGGLPDLLRLIACNFASLVRSGSHVIELEFPNRSAPVFDRMFNLTLLTVTLGKKRASCPTACASATCFQVFPVQTSMEYFSMCCPSFSHSMVRERLKVMGFGKSTSRMA